MDSGTTHRRWRLPCLDLCGTGPRFQKKLPTLTHSQASFAIPFRVGPQMCSDVAHGHCFDEVRPSLQLRAQGLFVGFLR